MRLLKVKEFSFVFWWLFFYFYWKSKICRKGHLFKIFSLQIWPPYLHISTPAGPSKFLDQTHTYISKLFVLIHHWIQTIKGLTFNPYTSFVRPSIRICGCKVYLGCCHLFKPKIDPLCFCSLTIKLAIYGIIHMTLPSPKIWNKRSYI